MPFQQFKLLRESFQYSFEMLAALQVLLVLYAVASASSYCLYLCLSLFTFNRIVKFSVKMQIFHCHRMSKNVAALFCFGVFCLCYAKTWAE